MSTPLISIILPTYNGSKYIKESIDSVLKQDYINYELIIINDASTDKVESIILEYQKKDSRIKYIRNRKNLGLTNSLNLGLKESLGKYIARIDDDDIWCDSSKLSRQVVYLENNPNCGLCGTGMILINEEGNTIDKMMNRENDAEIRNHISGSNQFAHSSIMMRKNILDSVGEYLDEKYTKYTEDYDLWMRIGTVSTFYNIQEYCIKYRMREGSISGRKRFTQLSNAFRVFLKYKSQYPNTIKGYIAHITTILMPRKIIHILVKINNRLTDK